MPPRKRTRKKKSALKARLAAKNKTLRARKAARPRRARRRRKLGRAGPMISIAPPVRKGLGPSAGGQSGDVQGLREEEGADSESVAELAEEGQDYEAEIVSGVENAPDPDAGEVITHEVPTDDIPPEYLERE